MRSAAEASAWPPLVRRPVDLMLEAEAVVRVARRGLIARDPQAQDAAVGAIELAVATLVAARAEILHAIKDDQVEASARSGGAA